MVAGADRASSMTRGVIAEVARQLSSLLCRRFAREILGMKTSIYWHIHKYEKNGLPFFKIGDTVNVFPGNNKFWSFYKNMQFDFFVEPGHSKLPASYAQYCLERNQIDPNGFPYIANAIKEAGMFLRELIFEEIRKSEFPNAPSRRNCIWLTEENNLKFWTDWLKNDFENICYVQFQCSGNFHIGNQTFLNSDIDNYDHYVLMARSYWSSKDIELRSNNEIIFTGDVTVLDVKNEI